MIARSHAQSRLTTVTVNPTTIIWLTGVPGAADSADELEVLSCCFLSRSSGDTEFLLSETGTCRVRSINKREQML